MSVHPLVAYVRKQTARQGEPIPEQSSQFGQSLVERLEHTPGHDLCTGIRAIRAEVERDFPGHTGGKRQWHDAARIPIERPALLRDHPTTSVASADLNLHRFLYAGDLVQPKLDR